MTLPGKAVPCKALDTYKIADLVKNAPALVKAGFVAAGVYSFAASDFKEKLTQEAAQEICKAGLRLFTIWENGFPTSASYFTATRGTADGAGAVRCARNVGQPSGTTIFFSVDYDAADTDLKAITTYFTAVHAKVRAAGYFVGIYGSGSVCLYLTQAGLAGASWLAQSTGFNGYEGWQSKATIVQGPQQTLMGMDVDLDTLAPKSAVTWTV